MVVVSGVEGSDGGWLEDDPRVVASLLGFLPFLDFREPEAADIAAAERLRRELALPGLSPMNMDSNKPLASTEVISATDAE